MSTRYQKIFRVLFFCLLCPIVLATISGITKNLITDWREHILFVIAIGITYSLTMVFTKWEKLKLKNVGIIPNKATFRRCIFGFGIGLFMTFLQLVFVLLFGHFTISYNLSISYYTVIFYLTLYILVAIREELAFRSYPIFSLNYGFGFWKSQLIILLIFSIEHIVGGMTWQQAFLGSGAGALLFGFAALRTKGIALPIGMHTAWNFGQWCFGFKKETGLIHGISEKGFENIVDRNGWISYFLIMTIAIVCFNFYNPKNKLNSTLIK